MQPQSLPVLTTLQELSQWQDKYFSEFLSRHKVMSVFAALGLLYLVIYFVSPEFLYSNRFILHSGYTIIGLGMLIKAWFYQKNESKCYKWWEITKIVLGVSFLLEFNNIWANLISVFTGFEFVSDIFNMPRLIIIGSLLIGSGISGVLMSKINDKVVEFQKLYQELRKTNSPTFAFALARNKVFFDGVHYKYEPRPEPVATPKKPSFNAEEYKIKRLEDLKAQDGDLNFSEKLDAQTDNIEQALKNAENVVQNNQADKKAALEAKRKDILKNL